MLRILTWSSIVSRRASPFNSLAKNRQNFSKSSRSNFGSNLEFSLIQSNFSRFESINPSKSTRFYSFESKNTKKTKMQDSKEEKTQENLNETMENNKESKESDGNIQLSDILNTFPLEPIGIFRSVFPEKNGTPRQGSLCEHTKGRLKITYGGNNTHHFVDGLAQFSHAHIIFLFHQNKLTTSRVKAKIEPPRLNGAKVGVFATRSPHRPNPIGLTIVKIEKVEGDTVYFSGVDLVDGTPVLDIKPYVPQYDSVVEASVPEWIVAPPVVPLEVEFTPESIEELKGFISKGVLEFYDDADEAQKAIKEVLTLDPRSVYWRRKFEGDSNCTFGFCVDVLNILCVFDPQNPQKAKIIKIEDWSGKYGHGKNPKDYHKLAKIATAQQTSNKKSKREEKREEKRTRKQKKIEENQQKTEEMKEE